MNSFPHTSKAAVAVVLSRMVFGKDSLSRKNDLKASDYFQYVLYPSTCVLPVALSPNFSVSAFPATNGNPKKVYLLCTCVKFHRTVMVRRFPSSLQ